MEYGADGTCKFTAGNGMGRNRDHRASHPIVIESRQKHRDQVIEMNPWQVLPARSDWTSNAEPERNYHVRQSAAVLAEHDSEARDEDSCAGGLEGGCFPVAADHRKKV